VDRIDFHTERLRAFVAVAQARGFSRGARRLGRTQSSVSQAIALLERELGEPLFVRDGRETHLTEAGRVLLVHAERAFAELAAARAELTALRDLAAGTLVLGTSDTLATYLLPPVFAAFRDRHPGVELRLDNRPSPIVAARVAERAVDLGLISLPLPDDLRIGGRPAASELRIEPLASHRDVLICPPRHPLAQRKRVSLSDLATQPLLLLDRTTATRAFLDTRFAAAGLTPRVVMEMSGVEILKRLVELDFGLSIVPEHAAAREVAQGTLATVPVRGLPARRVGLITPTAGPLSRAARAFIEVARAALQG
jgi:DNA-binding transcriptional LysR family regulator